MKVAILTIPDRKLILRDPGAITAYLTQIHIDYGTTGKGIPLPEHASQEEILAAWEPLVSDLKTRGGYTTADVIDIKHDTPGLSQMLDKFAKEHWHSEDEVRVVLRGHGVFFIRPKHTEVASVEVEAGDWIRVPAGTLHWFHLCDDRTIRAIRLFQDPAGWIPHYTASREEEQYAPVCFGPAQL